jgi:ubiquinone/menaquinone biosynthesis C-methylase UbiE
LASESSMVHEANIQLHRIEAKYYDCLHSEFNPTEEKRLQKVLKRVDGLILGNEKKALDFGCGTGNLALKILNLGYEVTAVDISAEMCQVLKIKCSNKSKLKIINSPIESAELEPDSYDLIVCYSALHHLPDYIDTIYRLSRLLKKGGVMFLDGEPSPFFWQKKSYMQKLLSSVYWETVYLLGLFWIRILDWHDIHIPKFDYSHSDYWAKENHHVEHDEISKVFQNQKFNYARREDYHLYYTKLFNPFFFVYRWLCKPDRSLWIAKK